MYKSYKNIVLNKFINNVYELGGKDPVYVREDCDLEKFVSNIVDGAMYNTGQFLYNLFTEKKYNQIKLFLKHVIPKNPFNRINMIKNEKKMTFFDFKKQICIFMYISKTEI